VKLWTVKFPVEIEHRDLNGEVEESSQHVVEMTLSTGDDCNATSAARYFAHKLQNELGLVDLGDET
jgi:hypothetical protein